LLLFSQEKQIKLLREEIETVKAKREQFPTSPYATASAFAKHAAKLREQALLEVEPLSEPTTSHPVIQSYPLKTNIVATVFWIGKKQGAGKMSREHESVWDKDWQKNYGGVDKA
jgi:hypothetical protein